VDDDDDIVIYGVAVKMERGGYCLFSSTILILEE